MLKIDKRTALVLALFAATLVTATSYATNNTTPVRPNSYTPGSVILSSQVNADFNTLYTELQGNVGTANLLDNCITNSKLAALSVTNPKLDPTVSNALAQTGVIQDYIGTTAPSGYVLADGLTIGDGSSGGTERANADTSALFTLLWNAMANAQAAVSGGRGATAAADFAAHKTITLPDLRGRYIAGLDNMGGTAANRITNTLNYDGTVNGNAGGAQSHTLTTAELATHSHPITDVQHTHTHNSHTHTDSGHNHTYNTGAAQGVTAGAVIVQQTVLNVANSTGNGFANLNTVTTTEQGAFTGITTTNNTGFGLAHTVLGPSYVVTKIIKL